MKIGDEVSIHGFVDEIRKDTVIIRNDGGYFGTVESEISDKHSTNNWVLMKDRLPEKNGDYICTIRVVTYYTQSKTDTDEYEENSVHRYVKVLNYQDGFPYMYNVIAWMPLPLPWKGEI